MELQQIEELTAKELFILKCFCDGEDRKTIAISQMITEKTLRHYLHKIYDKIGVTKLHQACVWFVRIHEKKD